MLLTIRLYQLIINLYLLSVVRDFIIYKYLFLFIILSLSPLAIGIFLLPEFWISFGIILFVELIVLLKTKKINYFRLSLPVIFIIYRLDA